MAKNTPITPWQLACTIIISALVIRLISLGLYPLQDTTEARYGEMVRLMVETNDWVTPWFDYNIPFWGKPPLFIWLPALSVKLLGLHEFTARLPSLLISLGVMGLCWKMALFQEGRNTARLSLLILTTTAVFILLSGALMAEPVMLLAIMSVHTGFWIGWHSGHASQARRWQYLFFVGSAMCLLAKGLAALVLAGIPILFWCLPERRLIQLWKTFPWVSGTLLTLALTLPWYIAAELKTPGFLNYFFIGEHISRYLESGWQGDQYGNAHRYPIGTIWVNWLEGGFPWSPIMIVVALKTLWERYRKTRANDLSGEKASSLKKTVSWNAFLWLCLLSPLMFFTFARNILWTYALPAAPAMAMLLASHWQSNQLAPLSSRFILGTAMVTPILLIGVIFALAAGKGQPSQKALQLAIKNTNVQTPGHIIYWYNRPFSGRFYSNGKALEIKDLSELVDTLDNGRQNFLITRNDSLSSLPETIKNRFEPKQHYRDWVYWLQKNEFFLNSP